MRNIRTEFYLFNVLKKNQLANYILSFSQTKMFEKYFEVFDKHKIEPESN